MQKLYRNIFAAGIISLGLAACGDDVTVTPPPAPPVPGVTSVTVSPATQTISVGQEVTFGAAVIADAGVTNTAVTWSSNNTAIASVEAATGKVKGLVPGTTTIVAKSNQDNSRVGVATVTVIALPAGVTSFNATPSVINLPVGSTQFGNITATYAAGVTPPTIGWQSLNGTVASVGADGKITANAPGIAIIRASATLPADPSRGTSAQTVTADITVNVAPTPSISIQAVTQGATTVPVNVSNVFGQIEVTLNFNPREQAMDSVVVYLDQPTSPTNATPVAKVAAKQVFGGTVPPAGDLTLSINTANYTKNPAAGTTTVSFLNGATTVRAAAYRSGVTGSQPISVANCSVAPNSPICASPLSLVLNNMDAWAADLTKPFATAQSAAGLTYWGGPGVPPSGLDGRVTATLYSVIYTPGRDVTNVNWTIGTASTNNTCAVSAETTRPWRRTWGYAATNVLSCTSHEWTGGGLGDRDNVIVGVALDNGANPYTGTLIANNVLLGSTPDSLRLDYVAPSVSTPSITRSAPAVTGWVNASFSFVNFASTDNGVGIRSTRDRATQYNVVKCPAAGAQNVAMPSGTGLDIPECGTNFIGGNVGIVNGTAPYTVVGTESDRLGNVGTSAPTQTFGVDKTNPAIRAGIAQVGPALVASVSADTTTFTTKPVSGTNVWRAEYLDERSGFSATAQRHAISVGSHIFPTGTCAVGTNPVGAAFITAPTCGLVTATPGALRLDGWQTGQQVDIPLPEQYATYTTNVTDAAGNVSSNLFTKVLVNALAPFATGLGIPAQLTSNNFGFLSTGADSAEVSHVSLQVTYPSLAGTAAGATDSVRYPRQSISTRFDNLIASPINYTIAPGTGAPYVHSIELVDATAFPGINTSAGTQIKPTKVQTFTFNFGGFNTASSEAAIPALNVENNATIAAFNAANPTVAINHWRVISTVTSANQFGSTVPLRAQAVAPTNSPNPPFTRVDFYRVVAGYYSYLGSVSSAVIQNSTACSSSVSEVCGTDQGTYRSWVYQLPAANYSARWDGVAQTTVVSTNQIIAIGVLSTGDAISTLQTTMVP